MVEVLEALSPQEVHSRLSSRRAVLVDIRETDEFARAHIDGALSLPLSRFDAARLPKAGGAEIIFTCRSGMRTKGACRQLAAGLTGPAFVLDGGVDAWKNAGLPLAHDHQAPLEMQRQVQLAAGMMILLGTALGALVSPAWFALPGFIGAGLTFAGATGTCGLARVLMLAPWNKSLAS